MYVPHHFREDDLPTLQAFMRAHTFATLITLQDTIPVASHLPITLNTETDTYGTLTGHVALGNQQHRTFDGTQEALVIFQGPHAYISASWYAEPEKAVPTWNYTAVHAYGTIRKMLDSELFAHLNTLTQTFEHGRDPRWTLDQDSEYIQRMARGIVGFTITIARLDGKFKLNQNRSLQDQSRVVQALHPVVDTTTSEVRNLMQSNIDRQQEIPDKQSPERK